MNLSLPSAFRLPWFLLALLACWLFPGGATVYGSEFGATTSPAESLTVVSDDNFPPYIFRNPSGQVEGYLVDLWKLWEHKTGIKVQLMAMSWAEAQKRVLSGEADVIDAIYRTPAREPLYDFSPTYAYLPVAIFAHRSISGIHEIASLQGFQVAVEDGDACIEHLERGGVTALTRFQNYAGIIEAASAAKVKIFCMDEYPANYYLYRMNADKDFVKAFELYQGEARRAVRKGQLAKLDRVEKGMALISADEKAALEKKWLRRTGQALSYTAIVAALALALLVAGSILLVWVRLLRIAVRKKTVELERSERRYRASFENSLDVVVITSVSDGKYLAVNQTFVDTTGFSAEEAIGRTGIELGLWVNPADRINLIEQLRSGHKVRNLEVQFRRKNGEMFWGLLSATLIEFGDTPCIQSETRDITPRKRAEQQVRDSVRHLRTLFEHVPIGMFQSTPQGQYVFMNPALAAMLGFDSPAQAIETINHTSIAEATYADPSHRPSLVEDVEQHEGQFRTFQNRYRRRDGRVFDALLCFSEQTDPFSGERFLYGFIQDISERVQAEARIQETLRLLQVATEAAKAASAAKSEFLAHMSHEIRTPLNAVLGLAQVLSRASLSADQRDMVERIQAAGQSLLVILNDILDFSKIEAGQLRLDSRPFALGGLLAKLDHLLGQSAHAKGLALRIDAPAELPGSLLGDGLRLEQVLVNLLGNAIKFTAQGKVTLRVLLLDTSAIGIRLRFEVQDTGIGIAPDALARLFLPFTQAEAGITRRFGGTGLGLSISKRLVELMGGEIGVESQVGQGSTFWVELPFQRAAAGEPVSRLPTAPERPAGPRLTGVRVLVVDDSAMNREVVERALKLEGATVTLAADGQQAVQQLTARPEAFDAVLMDVQMPVMDGLTATRLIRNELGLDALPIFALTAGVLPEQQQAARAAGVHDVLTKPLDLEQLVATLLPWVKPWPAVRVPTPDALAAPAPLPASPDPADEFPDIAGIDRACATEILGHDRAFFLRLLDGLVTEFADVVVQTRRELAQGQRETATRRLHTLRGNAGNLGALELITTAGALEEAIRRGETDLDGGLETLGRQLAALTAASAPWRETVAAAPSASSEVPPPLDAAQLDALCEALRDHNLKALRRFEALKPALRGAWGEERTKVLGQAIRGLRFEDALAVLAQPAVGSGDSATAAWG